MKAILTASMAVTMLFLGSFAMAEDAAAPAKVSMEKPATETPAKTAKEKKATGRRLSKANKKSKDGKPAEKNKAKI